MGPSELLSVPEAAPLTAGCGGAGPAPAELLDKRQLQMKRRSHPRCPIRGADRRKMGARTCGRSLSWFEGWNRLILWRRRKRGRGGHLRHTCRGQVQTDVRYGGLLRGQRSLTGQDDVPLLEELQGVQQVQQLAHAPVPVPPLVHHPVCAPHHPLTQAHVVLVFEDRRGWRQNQDRNRTFELGV